MADYDVVIVGANTPGMVAAFYLAKNGGKKVLVIEKSPYVGATAMTVEMVPGFKFHPAGTGEYYIHPQVLAELGLERHGAVRIPANPSSRPFRLPGPHTHQHVRRRRGHDGRVRQVVCARR